MLTECQNCNFYLQKNERFCCNCGYPPEDFIPEAVGEERQGSLILIFSCLTAILAGGVYLYSKSFDFTETSSLIFYLLLGFLGGAGFFKFVSVIADIGPIKRDRDRLYEFLDNAATLNYKDETLSQKLIELDADLRSVEDLEREADLNETNNDVARARDFVLTEIALCELQKERISLIRMENAMLPIIYRNGEFSDEEAENEIDQFSDQLEIIRLQISEESSLEFRHE